MGGCSVPQILRLHVLDIHTVKEIILFLTPFFNEFANLFTLTLLVPYFGFNLYPHYAHSSSEILLKTVIDFIALGGIVGNSVYAALQAAHDSYSEAFINGVVRGLSYLLYAFVIPNLFMQRILSVLPMNNWLRLGVGVLLIYLLDVCVHTTVCIVSYLRRRETSKTTSLQNASA